MKYRYIYVPFPTFLVLFSISVKINQIWFLKNKDSNTQASDQETILHFNNDMKWEISFLLLGPNYLSI